MKKAKRWSKEQVDKFAKPDLEGADKLAAQLSLLLNSFWNTRKAEK